MKAKILPLLFLLFWQANNIAAGENRPQSMDSIYQRIRNTLLLRQRNFYLNKRHTFKINLFFRRSAPRHGVLRLDRKNIKIINPQNQTSESLELAKIKRIEVMKWKRIRLGIIKTYVKYKFMPDKIKAITKKGRIFYISPADFSPLRGIYLFLPDQSIFRASTSFTLYYDISKKRYYGTNKPLGFHLNNPPDKTVRAIEIISYKFDKTRHNLNANNSQRGNTIKMKKTPSQLYFEKQRKLREEQRQRERQNQNQSQSQSQSQSQRR